MTEYKPGDLVLIRGVFSGEEHYSIIIKKTFPPDSDYYDVYLFGVGIGGHIYKDNIVKKIK
jgi:hypothetical protein